MMEINGNANNMHNIHDTQRIDPKRKARFVCIQSVIMRFSAILDALIANIVSDVDGDVVCCAFAISENTIIIDTWTL